MLKTFSDVQRRFETLREKLDRRGYHVETLELEPPVSQSVLMEHEAMWKHQLPDEMRKFLTEMASKIVFDWTDGIYMDSMYSVANRENPIPKTICTEPLISELYDPRWPVSCDFNFSLAQLDWLFGVSPEDKGSSYWAEVEECWNNAEYYDPISPYEYDYSTPFIYGIGGELLLFYEHQGNCFTYHYGDSLLEDWHKISKSFYEFWDRWSLFGCPNFGSYEVFYDEQTQSMDPYGVNAMRWRKFLEIDHM